MDLGALGVALAAVVACGCVGQAEAAAITAFGSATYTVSSNIPGQESFTQSLPSSFLTVLSDFYPEDLGNGDHYLTISTRFSGPFGLQATADNLSSFTPNYDNGATSGINYQVSQQYGLEGLQTGSLSITAPSGAIPADAEQPFAYTLRPGDTGVGGIELSTSFYDDDNVYRFYEASYVLIVASVRSIAPVPLPASGPLFSAALLGFGALGYGMKRRSQPQAA